MVKALFIALLFVGSVSQARSLNELFDMLKDSGVDYEPAGAICEQVAMIELKVLYPESQYRLVNSIEYTKGSETIGELDIVAINLQTNQADMVGEVKCWTSFKGGLKKAGNQRQRFQTYLNKKITIFDKTGKRYSKDQFKNVQKYMSISTKGAVEEGYDYELENSLDEMNELRKALLICQDQGRCPRKR